MPRIENDNGSVNLYTGEICDLSAVGAAKVLIGGETYDKARKTPEGQSRLDVLVKIIMRYIRRPTKAGANKIKFLADVAKEASPDEPFNHRAKTVTGRAPRRPGSP